MSEKQPIDPEEFRQETRKLYETLGASQEEINQRGEEAYQRAARANRLKKKKC